MLDAQPIEFRNFFTFKNEENTAPPEATPPDADKEKRKKIIEELTDMKEPESECKIN